MIRSRALACLVLVSSATGHSLAGNRPDIHSFTATQRSQLNTLMLAFIDKANVGEHCFTHGIHQSLQFLPWHRGYIQRMEDYLATHGGDLFVPLPKWNPDTPIPAPFDTSLEVASCWGNACANGPGACSLFDDTDPMVPLPFQFSTNLCANGIFSSFSTVLEGSYHNPVHGAVGGVMGNFNGPSAPIFYLWHAFVDDIWYMWECDCNLSEGTAVRDKTDLVGGADLWMQDSEADLGYEPNAETGANLWSSTDIWVQNLRDTLAGSSPDRYSNEHAHENPEYASNPADRPWIYVKTRNRGCSPVSGDLHIYWANASTGLDWDTQWNELPGSPVAVTSLPSAGIGVAELQWSDIPMPTPSTGSHFCLLARFEADSSTPDPIDGETFTPNIGLNVRNSNNIAWKNVTITDDVANKTGGVLIRNTGSQSAIERLDIRSIKDADGESYLDIGTLRAVMAPDLFNIWDAGGRQGSGFVLDPNGNDLIITSPSASIGGLTLPGGAEHLMNLEFDQTIGPCESGTTDFRIELIQTASSTNTLALPGLPPLPAGGMTYEFRTDAFRRPSPGVETSFSEQVECSSGSIEIAAVVPQPLPGGLTVTSYQWLLDGSLIPGETQPTIQATETGGYSVRVGYSNGCFSASQEIEFYVGGPPPNDDACDAAPLTLGMPMEIDNACATAQAGEVSPGVGGGIAGCTGTTGWCVTDPSVQNSVWYTFVAPPAGRLSLRAGHANLQLAVWRVTNCADFAGGFTEVAANDDGTVMGPWGRSPELTLSGLFPGATYYLQVDGYQGLYGGEEITVERIPVTGVPGIPALSTWGLALLAVALSMSALMMLRRKASRS